MKWLKRFSRILLVIVVLALLVAGARRIVMRRKAELAKAPVYGVAPVPVHIAGSVAGNMPVLLHYVAVVEPIRSADVCARITATVEKVSFDEGDRVQQGTPLLTLDDRAIRDDIASITALIGQARADLAANLATVDSLKRSVHYWTREAQRDRKLAERGSIPKAQAEGTAEKANEFQGKLEAARQQSKAIQQRIVSLESRKAAAQTQLSYCTLESPYTGVVSHRFVDPGDLAAPGKPLMVVEDRSRLKLAFDVPQEDLAQVRLGRPVQFKIGAKLHTARITVMYPSLNSARMTRAEVLLPPAAAANLAPGAYVPVGVVLKILENVTIVPGSTIIKNPGGRPYVFLVRKDRLQPQLVQVLAHAGDQVAVQGVAPGEEVVTSTFLGWARLADGMRVEAIR